MKLGLLSIGMVCLEWWSFEIMTMYSAMLGVREAAVQIIILNVETMAFMATLGIQFAA